MSMMDPIADMLTRMRNAIRAKHETVEMYHSKLKAEIARIMKREGFIADYVVEGGGTKKTLRIHFKQTGDAGTAIRGIRRISKVGGRHYVTADKIPMCLGGMGTVILTTSAGVMSGRECHRKKIGGEILCEIW